MKRMAIVLVAMLLLDQAAAQPPQLEIARIFGECKSVYAAAQDGLMLYREPNLNAEKFQLSYKTGWKIPIRKHEGLTRVIRAGSLRVLKPDDSLHCSIPPNVEPPNLVAGEIVEYLYYRGEGFGEIRFRRARCSAAVYEDFGHFETLSKPEVQVWLRVLFADRSSVHLLRKPRRPCSTLADVQSDRYKPNAPHNRQI